MTIIISQLKIQNLNQGIQELKVAMINMPLWMIN